MKKVSFIFVALFACAMVLTSCGGGASTEGTTDSTAVEEVAPVEEVAVDSVAVDTTQVQ